MDKWNKLKEYLMLFNKKNTLQEELVAYKRVLEEMERLERSK